MIDFKITNQSTHESFIKFSGNSDVLKTLKIFQHA